MECTFSNIPTCVHLPVGDNASCFLALTLSITKSIRPRTAASPSIQSVSHITLRHGDCSAGLFVDYFNEMNCFTFPLMYPT